MKKIRIESIRAGFTDGGMACGPVAGSRIAEVCWSDENGGRHYRSAAECDGTLSFFNTREETFEAQIAEEYEYDCAPENSADYTGYDSSYDFYGILPNRAAEEAALDLLLAYLIYEQDESVERMIQKATGKDIGTFTIPLSDDESEYYANIETDETDESYIMDRISNLLIEDESGMVDEMMDRFDDEFIIADEVFREAIRKGATDYVIEHAYEFDLNDEYEGSSYLSETDDPGIRDILIGMGALPSFEDYENCRFYYSSVTEEYEMDAGLMVEAEKKLFEMTGLTRETFIEKLRNEETCEDNLPEPMDNYTYIEIQAYLEIDDDVPDDIPETDVYPWEYADILESLGFNVEEEGDSGAHGHDSWRVVFVR